MLVSSGQNGFVGQKLTEVDQHSALNGYPVKSADVLMSRSTVVDSDGRKPVSDPVSSLLEKLDRCRLLADQYENPKQLDSSSPQEVRTVPEPSGFTTVESTVTAEVEIHNCRPIGGAAQADPAATKLSAALNISSKPSSKHVATTAAHCCSDVSCSASSRPRSTWAECLPTEEMASAQLSNNVGFGYPNTGQQDGLERFASLSQPLNDGIDISPYQNEQQMPAIMKLITKDLSEPYSIYTYRYFIHNWPHLCFLANDGGESVGAIVCKLDYHKTGVRRGYIAMLAVDEQYRRHKIGSRLVKKAIYSMMENECDEVVLETEVTNTSALSLYERLGFVRDKRLFRYYLNDVDAFRLKLWLRNPYSNFVNMFD